MNHRISVVLLVAATLALLHCRAPVAVRPSAPAAEHPVDQRSPSARSEVAIEVAKPEEPASPCEPIEGAPILERIDKATPREIALTFDDGPHLVATPKVLDLLEKERLHATFFVVGEAINARTYWIVQREIAEGHVVGSHSYNHEVEMASYGGRAASEAYVFGEHEVTRILVNLAVLATSPDDFNRLYTRVFALKPFEFIPRTALAADVSPFTKRYQDVLVEHGRDAHDDPYRILYSRPPGGGPYLSLRRTRARDAYDDAMERIGFVNVLWHSAAGDTDEAKGADAHFLLDNLHYGEKRGGVVLLHDRMSPAVLATGLREIARDGSITVVELDALLTEKYACAAEALIRGKAGSSRTPSTGA